LSDEGALRLDEELKYFRNNIINILEKYPAWGSPKLIR
jgi:hypothetical protein